jgi:TolB-like protein/class 3 adenylate cyclase/tetratricopeptide (TPR) repeat protein
MASTRRLVAILAADVAGYSRLMGADEEGTLERLKAHRRELIDPRITEHQGRIVKTTGDGLLVEFPSVVDAVRCAVEVQRGMMDREPEITFEHRIRFRVGINLGDVIADGDDIIGDGVNVAARLESLAEPGGICISRPVRDQIRDKLPYQFEDLGEQSVKNIARPVRSFTLRPEAIAGLPAPDAGPSISIQLPPIAPRLSIVVLPFGNLSDDKEQQYFADGITEDLTTDLSRIPDMLVISRNTAFTYRGKAVDTRQIGRELGVRYVLEGSVRRLKDQVRINAQLIETETDVHLWADRFDCDADDLFVTQSEITSQIAVALNLELVGTEAHRPTDHPDALEYILRGRAKWLAPSRETFAEAISLFEKALALDPRSSDARSWLAGVLSARAIDQMSASPIADVERADELVHEALGASPRSALAHFARGQVLRAQGRWREAISEYEIALASNRNWVGASAYLGWCKFWTGSVDEAMQLHRQAMRLSPRDPYIGIWYFRLGLGHLVQSHTEEAVAWLEKARSAIPGHPNTRATLASAYALIGEIDLSAAELAEARRLVGDDRFSSIARLKEVGFFGVGGDFGAPSIRALMETTYFPGLRKAGVPEE